MSDGLGVTATLGLVSNWMLLSVCRRPTLWSLTTRLARSMATRSSTLNKPSCINWPRSFATQNWRRSTSNSYTDQDDLTHMKYTRQQGMRFFQNFNQRGLAMTTAEEFPPSPNVFACKWCPYGPREQGTAAKEFDMQKAGESGQHLTWPKGQLTVYEWSRLDLNSMLNVP